MIRCEQENLCGRSPWSLPTEPQETMHVSYGSPTREVLCLEDLAERRKQEDTKVSLRKTGLWGEWELGTEWPCIDAACCHDPSPGGPLTARKATPSRVDEDAPPPAPHIYATASGTQPQFIDARPNRVVAPVRHHHVQYFPALPSVSSEAEPGAGPCSDEARGSRVWMPASSKADFLVGTND
jgi:hypothetical protein